MSESRSAAPSSESSAEAPLDVTLALLGFEFDEISPQLVSGRLPVTPKCCQPMEVLAGGVSALIAESLASIGAHLASGLKRVAGFNLNIHHVKSAQLGDLVFAQATPISVGRTAQVNYDELASFLFSNCAFKVWNVSLWKMSSSEPEKKIMISSARVALLCHLPIPDGLHGAISKYRKYAKL